MSSNKKFIILPVILMILIFILSCIPINEELIPDNLDSLDKLTVYIKGKVDNYKP